MRIDTLSYPSFKGNISKTIIQNNGKNVLKELKLYNPLTKDFNFTNISKLDCSKKQKIFLNQSCMFANTKNLTVEFDPSFIGQLYDKKAKQYFDVRILKYYTNEIKTQFGFAFMSKDLCKQYGYVLLNYMSDKRRKQILASEYKPDSPIVAISENYPDVNIDGERIIIEFLENFFEKDIGGVGKLADKLQVKYCYEHNIKPNLISISAMGTAVNHYLRGKRFIIPPRKSDQWEFLLYRYGKTNPNEILDNEVKRAQGGFIDDTDWPWMVMYLPKNLIEKYIKE